MSRSLTKWKVLKQKFSPASKLHILCSHSWILTSTPLPASSSLLNVNAFLPVVLLKCAFLPPALALFASLSSFLPKRNPSLHNVKSDRSVGCVSSSTDYSYPFCLPEEKFHGGIFDTTLLNCQLLLQLFSGPKEGTHFSLPAQFPRPRHPRRGVRLCLWLPAVPFSHGEGEDSSRQGCQSSAKFAIAKHSFEPDIYLITLYSLLRIVDKPVHDQITRKKTMTDGWWRVYLPPSPIPGRLPVVCNCVCEAAFAHFALPGRLCVCQQWVQPAAWGIKAIIRSLGAILGHTERSQVLNSLTGGSCITLGTIFGNATEELYFNFFSGLLNKEGSAMELPLTALP